MANAEYLRTEISRSTSSLEKVAIVAQYGNEPELFAAFLAAQSLEIPITFVPQEACSFRAIEVATAMAATSGASGQVLHLKPRMGTTSLDGVESELLPNVNLKKMGFDIDLSRSVDRPLASLDEYLRGSGNSVLYLFTSGTTGRPKGIGFHPEAIDFFARNILRSTEISSGARELLIPNIAHSDGWQRGWAAILNGGQVDLVSTKKLLLEFEQTLRASDPDSFFLPTPMIPMLTKLSAETREFINSRRRSVELGSTAIPSVFFKRLLDCFPRVDFFYHYGLTECSRTATLKVRDFPKKWETVGRVNSGFIVDAEGATLRIKNGLRPRRLIIEGKLAEDREEYLVTKDLGSFDSDGFLILKGRTDDMLTLGGHHVFPKEIESIVMSMPGARFCRVVRPAAAVDPIFGDMIDVQVGLEEGVDSASFLSNAPSLFRSYISFHDKLSDFVVSAKGIKV